MVHKCDFEVWLWGDVHERIVSDAVVLRGAGAQLLGRFPGITGVPDPSGGKGSGYIIILVCLAAIHAWIQDTGFLCSRE